MKNNKGITLIALIITIIVMLILVAVTITVAVNGGLFEQAQKAAQDTEAKKAEENALASGRIKIGDTWYDSPQDYVDGKPSADQTGTSGGESETPQEPATGTHTWEKYSFALTFLVSDSITKGCDTRSGCPYGENPDNIVRYSHVKFGENNFSLTGEWRGNYSDWMEGQYLNYPFGVDNNYHFTFSGCEIYRNEYRRALTAFKSINMESNGVANYNVLYYFIYPEAYTIQSITQGTFKYGEVTSDDSTAYPTNGFKDGYWYVYKSAQ